MTPEQLKKFIDDFEDDDKLFELDYNLHDRAVQALLDLWNKMICPFDSFKLNINLFLFLKFFRKDFS